MQSRKPAGRSPAIQSQTVTAGGGANFNVSASGTAPLGYQWRFNGAAISGASGTALSLANVQTSQGGNYTVVVANSVGSATSAVAVLTVTASGTAPAITTQPASQSVSAGGNATFNVSASGTAPLGYQWRFNGATISGASGTTLSLANVQLSQGGNYTVVVTNSVGSVTSAVAVLTVTTGGTAPAITTQPASQSVVTGGNATFSVSASGAAPLAYQWTFNGFKLSGATTASLTLTGVQSGNAGTYAVTVINNYGSVTSAGATFDGEWRRREPNDDQRQSNSPGLIDGFGANLNHRSWNNDELKPVIDALINQAGMTLFHVIFDNNNWESTNDNNNANVMNWNYYNTIYSSAEFQKMWGLMGYLNQQGITAGLVPDFEGPAPAWMGGLTLTPGYENEYAETIASCLIYARKTMGLQFSMVGPVNEPDITYSGINLSGSSQYVTVMSDLATQLNNNGMSDVQFSGPDLANTSTSWLQAIMNNPSLMSRYAHFGLHSYQNESPDASGVYNFIKQSSYPATHFWMTEYNVWCSSCQNGNGGDNSWSYGKGTAAFLMQLLSEGASAGIVWEGYDSQYVQYNPQTGGNNPPHWSYWGLFAVDNINASPRTYTPRKGFYTLAQIALFVRPGAQRINVSNPPSGLTVLAFYNPGSGQFTITGVNSNSSATSLSCALASLPSISSLDLYYTSSSVNLSYAGQVPVNNGAFSVSVPADCVFTLTYTNASVPGASVRSPPVAPQFATPFLQNNRIQFSVSAAPGNPCQIQASSDLVNWQVITNVVADDTGAIQFTDPAAANFSHRFYRAVVTN